MAPLPELHAVDGGRGQPAEGGIRVRAFLPRRCRRTSSGRPSRCFKACGISASHSVGRLLAQALVVELVVGLLRGPVPELPEVVLDGRAFSRAKQRLLRRRRPGRRRAPAAALEPEHRVAAPLAGQHRRRRAFQRQRHHASGGLADGRRPGSAPGASARCRRAGLPLAVRHFSRARCRCVHDTACCVARSHHSLLMMPCVDGSVPVLMVAWPGAGQRRHVRVGGAW